LGFGTTTCDFKDDLGIHMFVEFWIKLVIRFWLVSFEAWEEMGKSVSWMLREFRFEELVELCVCNACGTAGTLGTLAVLAVGIMGDTLPTWGII
jgi:hypothetical protein